jgi:hypothetical protein
MALVDIQPTLPPEGEFTNPELNFIDESPRGFFPENQDSNWGWKRKIFTDKIQVAFLQLETIFSEIFPASSQDYLDEWEEAVGLPQSPSNKTLAQRRAMVINRLRGGPFTRTQRRAIVESYITATFGDPILLLPPGHALSVGGSPLYNEPGDAAQLYMILETVEQFKYEVRIKTAMALDQLGLERDLKWFTPAGIQIIFNYAWEGKFPTETGTAADSISGRRIAVQETGIGSEAYGVRGTDAGSGADTGKLGQVRTETGTSTETASITKYLFTVEDSGTSREIASPIRVLDTGTGTDFASKT